MTNDYTIEELKVHNRDLLAEALAYKNRLYKQFPDWKYEGQTFADMPVTPFLLSIYLPLFHDVPHSTRDVTDKMQGGAGR